VGSPRCLHTTHSCEHAQGWQRQQVPANGLIRWALATDWTCKTALPPSDCKSRRQTTWRALVISHRSHHLHQEDASLPTSEGGAQLGRARARRARRDKSAADGAERQPLDGSRCNRCCRCAAVQLRGLGEQRSHAHQARAWVALPHSRGCFCAGRCGDRCLAGAQVTAQPWMPWRRTIMAKKAWRGTRDAHAQEQVHAH